MKVQHFCISFLFSLFFITFLSVNLSIAERSCNDDILVFSCFEAYKHEPTELHRAKIDHIIALLKMRQAMGMKVQVIHLRGYGVQFRPTDPYKEMAQKRAESIRDLLSAAMTEADLDTDGVTFEILPMADAFPIATNSTQKGRAVNRRVEIMLFSGPSMLGLDGLGDSPANDEFAPCSTVIPYPNVSWLNNKQLRKVRRGDLQIDFSSAEEMGGEVKTIAANVLARWSCQTMGVNILHSKNAPQPYDAESVSPQLVATALSRFQVANNLSTTTGGILDGNTLQKLDTYLGLSSKSDATPFVTMATEGIYGDPETVLEYFNSHYDANEHLTRSLKLLRKYKGDLKLNEERLQNYFNSNYKGNFKRLQNVKKYHKQLGHSLKTINTMPRREEMALAATFVIGFREAGKNLLLRKELSDTWGKSGLDFLFKNQGKMRKNGFLPMELKFKKGDLYGKTSPETGKPINSARVKAKDIFLAHSASFNYAYFRFTKKAKKRGYTLEEIDKIDRLGKAYWLCQDFSRPGGCDPIKPDCKATGILTILGFYKEKSKSLDRYIEITKIKRFNRKKTINIAVRTSAIIVALDTMMAKHARELAKQKKEEYLEILGRRFSEDT